ncbi:MAG: ABC transporter permease [Acidobacteriota bacterium]|nr:MAG: ABC transporter permease [Acidobacteriota bacterium]
MSLGSRAKAWLRAKLAPEDVESEIEDELRFHLEMRARDYEARGLSGKEAAHAAKRRFGNVNAIRYECRRLSNLPPAAQGDRLMNDWLLDVRFTLRSLGRNPSFTAIVVVTLALGIGATTAIFSVVEGVLLRRFPYRDSDRLVMLWENDRLRGTTQEWFSAPDFFDVRERADVFESLALFQTPSLTLTDESREPLRVDVSVVSASLYPVLGSEAMLGRTFYSAEDRPGGDRVAILSHRLWSSRFGRDQGILGRRVFIEGESTKVVGVMGPEFRFPASADLWIPAQVSATTGIRGRHSFHVIARLAEGVSLERASSSLQTIASGLETEYPDVNQGRGMWAESLYQATVGGARTPLLALLGAVVFVLLIACANVANLLFARSLAREHEIAIRTAMGAGRVALVRQSLIEGLTLSCAGGFVGLFVAYAGLDVLLALAPSDLPRVSNVGVHGPVLLFALALSLATGVLFGLASALRVAKDVAPSLKEGSRSAGGSKHRGREILVAAEIALAVVLVVGAGLLITSFWKMLQVDPGFTPANVVSVDIQLPASRYPQDRGVWPHWNAVRQFQDELVRRAVETPGVDAASLALNGPLDAGWTSRFTIEGRPEVAPGQQDEVRVRIVSPDYFRTVGVPVISGRALEPHDSRADAPPVMVVNQAFAKRYSLDEEPLGARVTQWDLTREIVGIVQDVRFRGLDTDAEPAIYPTFSQAPFPGFSLLLRSREPPERSFARMREIVGSMDPELALSHFTTLEDRLSAAVAGPRFTMILFGLFAGVALVLAALGVYGVTSYSVAERTHEIGVRMTLGAGRHEVLGVVLVQGLRLAAFGTGFGIVAAIFLSRTLETLLFGVERLDPVTFATVPLLAAFVALTACYVPAVRATRVDPISTLRHE